MKRVVSISLGSASRDHKVEIELLGQRVLIERIGANGDAVRAAQMFADLDGQVDALGMGGIDLGLQVGDRWYPLHGAFKLVEKVSKTPVVDGGGLKATLEARVMQFVQARIGDEISPKRAIVTAGTDRFGMGASFVAAGYDTVFCDFMFALGLPIPIRGLNNVERLAAILLPILGRLPIDMIYPTGAKQEQIVPKFVKWYAWASVIGGDCHYIKRHLPARLDGKVIVTNTTTPADVQLFRSRGVKYLVTTTPNLDGRTFGTNVMEGVLVALAGKGRKLAPVELSEMMAQLHWEPTIQKLEPG